MKRPIETAFALQPKQLAAATGSAKVLELECFLGTFTVFAPEACSVHNAPDTVLLGLPLSWAATMMPFARTRVGHNEAFGKSKPCWLGRLLSCATHGRGIHAVRRHSRATRAHSTTIRIGVNCMSKFLGAPSEKRSFALVLVGHNTHCARCS